MSFWSRFTNVFRGDRLTREIDVELESHIEEAIEQGRDPAETRRAFGSTLRQREQSRDVRLIAWLDTLRADGQRSVPRLRLGVSNAEAHPEGELGIIRCDCLRHGRAL